MTASAERRPTSGASPALQMTSALQADQSEKPERKCDLLQRLGKTPRRSDEQAGLGGKLHRAGVTERKRLHPCRLQVPTLG